MARIRTVKPELFRHKKLYQLERETGLPLRVAWIALFTVADRDGRFRWDPEVLKLDTLPFDKNPDGTDLDFSRVLDALWTRGFIEKYVCEGEEYGFIPTWKAHQVINNRESSSKLPKPTDNSVKKARVGHAWFTRHELAQGEEEGKGREKEGEEEGVEANTTAPELEPLDFGDEEPEDPQEQNSSSPPPNTNVNNFQVIEELAKDSTLAEVLRFISTGVQEKWVARYEINWLKTKLLDAICHHLEKENAQNPAQITDWGLRLGKWLRREKKPNLLESKKNISQEIEDLEAELSRIPHEDGGCHGN